MAEYKTESEKKKAISNSLKAYQVTNFNAYSSNSWKRKENIIWVECFKVFFFFFWVCMQTAIVEAEGLPPLNPIMLGSNLNYSVFLYDIVKARRRFVLVSYSEPALSPFDSKHAFDFIDTYLTGRWRLQGEPLMQQWERLKAKC